MHTKYKLLLSSNKNQYIYEKIDILACFKSEFVSDFIHEPEQLLIYYSTEPDILQNRTAMNKIKRSHLNFQGTKQQSPLPQIDQEIQLQIRDQLNRIFSYN